MQRLEQPGELVVVRQDDPGTLLVELVRPYGLEFRGRGSEVHLLQVASCKADFAAIQYRYLDRILTLSMEAL